jgi:ribosome-interacting GTPase 1
MGLNLGTLIVRIWENLDLIRVFTQPKGEPLVLNSGKGIIRDFCNKIHTSITWVTGTSVQPYLAK